jgi:NB-ARC domain
MGGTASMFYSGAVEAAAGTMVSGAVCSVTSTCELQEGLHVTLYSLQQEVMKIQCAINAARRRRITDPQLLMWLASLINAVHLGNYYYRTIKSQNSYPQMTASEDMNDLVIPLSYRTSKRQRTLKNLIFGDEELKKLNDTLRILKSIDICAFILMVNALPERPLKTYLYMDHNRLFGRDKERDQIMKFLLEPSTAGENNVDILPIVGSRGVGKTSLVLHCFYDPIVQNHFSLKIFNPCSHISHPTHSIFRKSLQLCDVYDITNNDENTLIAMLKQNLSSERFLFVMDSVSPVDSMVWNALWDCLRCGKQGSKVIFIASFKEYNNYKKIINLGMVKPIILDHFTEDNYMLFFMEHAFGSVDPEDYPELEKMGREMVTKMNGSIWGAKIFGELLRDNLNAQFWSILQEGLLNLKKFRSRGDLLEVVEVISQILSKRLPVKDWGLLCRECTNKDELKSFRELMVLGPDHCTVVNNEGEILLVFLLTKQVFLNECRIFAAAVVLESR